MEIVKSNRGGGKLSLDGYMYVKKRTYKNWIRWHCWDYDIHGRYGSAISDIITFTVWYRFMYALTCKCIF